MDPVDQFPPRPPARPPLRGFAPLVDSLRDRASDPRVRVGALLATAAVAGFFWYRVGQDRPSTAWSGGVPSSQSSGRRTVGTTTTKPAVLVHVAGAVVRPGLVRVGSGARIADAIAAAGGGTPDADLDRLNLAAKVIDGQRVAVSRIGAPGAPAVGDGSVATGAAPTSDAGAAAVPINLNTATQAQLETLPGIGPSLAAAILRERDRRGGFTSVDQLREVRGVGAKRFADLKPMVTI